LPAPAPCTRRSRGPRRSRPYMLNGPPAARAALNRMPHRAPGRRDHPHGLARMPRLAAGAARARRAQTLRRGLGEAVGRRRLAAVGVLRRRRLERVNLVAQGLALLPHRPRPRGSGSQGVASWCVTLRTTRRDTRRRAGWQPRLLRHTQARDQPDNPRSTARLHRIQRPPEGGSRMSWGVLPPDPGTHLFAGDEVDQSDPCVRGQFERLVKHSVGCCSHRNSPVHGTLSHGRWDAATCFREHDVPWA